MKRKLLLLVVITLTGILSACQTPDNSVIPMMIYDQDDLFMQTFEASLLEASQAYGYTFDV